MWGRTVCRVLLINSMAYRYDWRQAEARLNTALPMFTRDVAVDDHGTLNVHYVHAKSKVEGAIPLLFVHGCMRCFRSSTVWKMLSAHIRVLLSGPGSFLEVIKILPMLLDPKTDGAPAFHVVAPSLPGYGFSEGPKKPGFGPIKMGEVSDIRSWRCGLLRLS